MTDPRLEKLAKVLVQYSIPVRKGDLVHLTGNLESCPLIELLYEEVLRAGGNPWVRLVPASCSEALVRVGSDKQIQYCGPLDKAPGQKADAVIKIWSDPNTKAMSSADPARQAMRSKAMRPVMQYHMKRAALPETDPNHIRWTGTLLPTQAHAQDAEMSLREYEDFVFRAGKLHKKDPVAEWKKLGKQQQKLADRLEKSKVLRFRTPDGTDIRFGVDGRHWINCDGRNNFPDGEVFTGPIEDATEGVVQYRFPAVYAGREVRDIRLEFKAGRVVEASASTNETFLFQMLDQDKGGRVLGELALGSNYGIKRHTKNILFDEKIGGTFHLALGAAYPESGGKNKSALHWDMICDLRKGGTVEIDGEVISRNGKFLNPGWPR